MFKKPLSRNDLVIIFFNLIPVYGVWFEGWSAIEVFIAYALETLIIGGFTIVKLLIATILRGHDTWYSNNARTEASGFFFIFFFIVHYGIFVAVQMSMFSMASGINPPGSGLLFFVRHLGSYINWETGIMLLGFIVSYALRDLVPFFLKNEHRSMSMMLIMFQPYGRIFIQQFVVIIGSMFLTFGWGAAFVVVFAAIKIVAEIYLNFDGLLRKAESEAQKEDSAEASPNRD